jgi:hypothetical protein
MSLKHNRVAHESVEAVSRLHFGEHATDPEPSEQDVLRTNNGFDVHRIERNGVDHDVGHAALFTIKPAGNIVPREIETGAYLRVLEGRGRVVTRRIGSSAVKDFMIGGGVSPVADISPDTVMNVINSSQDTLVLRVEIKAPDEGQLVDAANLPIARWNAKDYREYQAEFYDAVLE